MKVDQIEIKSKKIIIKRRRFEIWKDSSSEISQLI